MLLRIRGLTRGLGCLALPCSALPYPLPFAPSLPAPSCLALPSLASNFLCLDLTCLDLTCPEFALPPCFDLPLALPSLLLCLFPYLAASPCRAAFSYIKTVYKMNTSYLRVYLFLALPCPLPLRSLLALPCLAPLSCLVPLAYQSS
jgi:hypothetical protein